MEKGKARHRAGRAARYIKGGIVNRAKANGIPGLAGGAAELAVEFAAEHLEFVNKKWWGGPAVKFGASAMLKDSRYAHAVAGAAGSEAVFNYKLKQFQDGKTQHSPVRDFRDQPAGAPAAAGNAQGREDPGEAGMLFGAN